MASRTYGDRTLSPNQEFRRAEITEATCRLLRTRGVAACTVRTIADEAGVSKGVIHYYFADVHELVELGFAQLAATYYAHIGGQAASIADPVQALWHAIVSYVAPWDAHSSMALLWCEYYVASLRAGRLGGVVAMQQAMQDLFAAVLARVSPDVVRHAGALTRHVTGTVLTQTQMPVDVPELVSEISRLTGVPAPVSVDAGCDDPHCAFHGPGPRRSRSLP
ncbi:TetR/AcrR family transcriptional regulator [Pseudonocardia bannensis]|uniref:TetR/AcrR family transcriptional regulator n=1 Tax=Pseudonocardia bannensis TaxID=630973 RepID=A0A848DPC6_9PSEU|nr:TetR/AcrR family transcriptional regulator [Pseudonocardia bannensis]NMH94385.1 TetR/AcrR family transcriptional regulator [Pseudonocardia bannensis]